MSFLFILNTFYPNIGGVEQATLEICKQLKKRLYNIYILTTNKSNYYPNNKHLRSFENFEGIPIYRVKYTFRFITIPLKAFYLIKKFKINRLYISDFLGFVAIFFKKLYHIPFVYVLNGYNPICPTGILFHTEICQGFEIIKCLKYCQKFSVRFILAFIITRILLIEAHPVIAISKTVKDAYLSYFKKIPIKSIYYGVDLQKFHSMPINRKILPNNLKESDKIILFFGRLIKERGVFEFLPHFKSLLQQINCKFLIVGFGPELPNIKARVRKLNLQNHVIFTGILTNQPLINIINLSDIIILPNLFPEPLGLVVLEAMACAKPIISFDLGGIKELLKDVGPKLLIPPNDWKQFTDKISEFLTNKELRTTVGLALRQRAEKYFNWNRFINQFLKQISLNEV